MWSANMGPTKGSKRTFIVKAKGKPFNLEAFLAHGNGGTRISKHKKGETIFTQGDTCDGVFYIREGSCKITIVSEQGKEAVAALHEKGDFLGKAVLRVNRADWLRLSR
jgi:CRP/FNR family transcriptional regulator, cyclic AMP receptor protein